MAQRHEYQNVLFDAYLHPTPGTAAPDIRDDTIPSGYVNLGEYGKDSYMGDVIFTPETDWEMIPSHSMPQNVGKFRTGQRASLEIMLDSYRANHLAHAYNVAVATIAPTSSRPGRQELDMTKELGQPSYHTMVLRCYTPEFAQSTVNGVQVGFQIWLPYVAPDEMPQITTSKSGSPTVKIVFDAFRPRSTDKLYTIQIRNKPPTG